MNERECRRIVVERANAMCERCGNVSRGLTCHHRKKRSQQKGGWWPSNIVLLCGHGTTPNGCHSFAEHNPNDARAEGFHVRSYENELEVPVLRWGTFVYLKDDGSVEAA